MNAALTPERLSLELPVGKADPGTASDEILSAPSVTPRRAAGIVWCAVLAVRQLLVSQQASGHHFGNASGPVSATIHNC